MRLVEGVIDVDDVDAFVAEVDGVASETGTTIQAFDARYVASRRHIERAVELADRATERGGTVARDRAVEILLYAAGRRQITDALELGVSEGRNRVVVLVDAGLGVDGAAADRTEADAAEAVRSQVLDAVEPTLGDYDPERVRAYFDIGDVELDVVDGDLEALVLERVALLVVER
ncbi:KEOPS complex component [Halobellus salinus]|uniref:KEOPS complex component n=1 Tax=Halobellus salinus TaxID=931585 RepID=A0A830EIC2_9EURY|nr:KEOPS complex subunit Cgi121 [Halobellus salinus]GGJ07823.1 KEOPS complex component [Halobellus salinus]SMP26590.1 KEOPS complex subunit Cgi121 [Halobellus salinus]